MAANEPANQRFNESYIDDPLNNSQSPVPVLANVMDAQNGANIHMMPKNTIENGFMPPLHLVSGW